MTLPSREERGNSVWIQLSQAKSIRLSEDAYERLAAHKREDETFSDVVLRLAGERSLMGIAGILTDDEADAMRCERPSRSDVSIGARMSKPSPMNSTGPESCFWTRRSSST